MTGADQLALLNSTACGDRFTDRLHACGLQPLRATGIDILQLNITRRCNLACKHCHVNASPDRTEMMSRETMDHCIRVAQAQGIAAVDITGGAPELHPDLEYLLRKLCRAPRRVIVRTNLVILLDEPWRKYLDLYTKLGVEVAASLPDYHALRTDRVRGANVFSRSLEAIRELNQRGYGRPGSNLVINLVHNPAGAYLPGNQQTLETEYRHHLLEEYGVTFNNLFSLTNTPINRYLTYLQQSDNLDEYMQALRCAFNPAAAKHVMCRNTLSVNWEGFLYDCDFNQQLGLKVNHNAPNHIADFQADVLTNREIIVHEHCYACCAGSGSSCQGTLE
jgi:radical SAM/Cys-rich protein